MCITYPKFRLISQIFRVRVIDFSLRPGSRQSRKISASWNSQKMTEHGRLIKRSASWYCVSHPLNFRPIYGFLKYAETESRHGANFVVTGGTVGCHNDNLRCHLIWHHDDLVFSVVTVVMTVETDRRRERGV